MAESTDETELLKTRAQALGIPLNSAVYKPMSEGWRELAITAAELHRRIREEERHLRENDLHRLAKKAAQTAWWAAAASVISAVIALLALVYPLTV